MMIKVLWLTISTKLYLWRKTDFVNTSWYFVKGRRCLKSENMDYRIYIFQCNISLTRGIQNIINNRYELSKIPWRMLTTRCTYTFPHTDKYYRKLDNDLYAFKLKILVIICFRYIWEKKRVERQQTDEL